MTNDVNVTNRIIGKYPVFLLQGFTILGEKIEVNTIEGYLRTINKWYRSKNFQEPWLPKDDSDASRLIETQRKFQEGAARRDPLTDAMCAKMCELSKADKNPLGFKAAAWNYTAVGRYGGFRAQEFCMESKTVIRYYVLPDGTYIVRAFTVKNFIFYDDRGNPVKNPLKARRRCAVGATEYDVQKNRMNGQIISYKRLQKGRGHRHYCPVENMLDILARAQMLGKTEAEDPLCVYHDDKKKVVFLTGDDMTSYYRFVMRLTRPGITEQDLALISTHSLRVYACVLLHEAGKDGPYTKLWLRWLSNCFEVYLRNTDKIRAQHNDALDASLKSILTLAARTVGMDGPVHVNGIVNLSMDEVDNED